MRRLTIALIAHDSKKEDMVQLVKDHKESLSELAIIATGNTGRIVRERTKLPVTLMQSGTLGGDQQIGALVANGQIDAVVFLRDPLTASHNEPDVSALMRVCDVHNIPLATNTATAEAILRLIVENPGELDRQKMAVHSIEGMAAI